MVAAVIAVGASSSSVVEGAAQPALAMALHLGFATVCTTQESGVAVGGAVIRAAAITGTESLQYSSELRLQ